MTSGCAHTATLLRASARAYALAAVHWLETQRPELMAAGLPASFCSPVQDTEVRILHLAAAVQFDRPALLQHAVAWYRVAFRHRGVADDYLPANLAAIGHALRAELPPPLLSPVQRHLDAAAAACAATATELPSHLSRTAPHGELALHFLLAILEGRGEDALDRLRAALAAGTAIADLHDHVIAPVQRETGRMWLMGEIPIADEHYASGVVERALWLLQERVPRPAATAPVIVSMGVGGDLHGLGLRLVGQRLQLDGFVVHELGANMPAADIAWALHDRRVDLLAVSATLTLHLHTLVDLIAAVRAARPVPVLVGGEPFRVVPDLHRLVGADAAATDAATAVTAARSLLPR